MIAASLKQPTVQKRACIVIAALAGAAVMVRLLWPDPADRAANRISSDFARRDWSDLCAAGAQIEVKDNHFTGPTLGSLASAVLGDDASRIRGSSIEPLPRFDPRWPSVALYDPTVVRKYKLHLRGLKMQYRANVDWLELDLYRDTDGQWRPELTDIVRQLALYGVGGRLEAYNRLLTGMTRSGYSSLVGFAGVSKLTTDQIREQEAELTQGQPAAPADGTHS